MRLILPFALLFVGCSQPHEGLPDGSCGIEGTCRLPAEPPGADGVSPGRRPWGGGQVAVYFWADGSHSARVPVDAAGGFRVALHPGRYSVGRHDPDRLHGKMLTPLAVTVEAGRFTRVELDYDKMNVRDVPGR